jgi:hypothetical protein
MIMYCWRRIAVGQAAVVNVTTVQTLLKLWLLVGYGWLGVVEEQIAASEALGLIRVAWRLLVLDQSCPSRLMWLSCLI